MFCQIIISTLTICSLLNPTNSFDHIIEDNTVISTVSNESLTSGVTSDIYNSLSNTELVKSTELTGVVSGIVKELAVNLNSNNSQTFVESTDNFIDNSNTDNINGKITYTVNSRNFTEITEDEYNLLCQIVAAEAGTYQSREMVAEVVLNRKEITGKSIIDIVYEKNQFEPVSDGRLWTVQVTQDVKDAVNEALIIVHHPKEMLFFRNNHYHELETTIPYMEDGNTYFSLCYCFINNY